MMTYADWNARGPAVCDAECAEAMGWHLDKDGNRIGDLDGWSPTTDRNATALLIERVYWGDYRMIDRLAMALDSQDLGGRVDALNADPSLLAYCCVRAMREEA